MNVCLGEGLFHRASIKLLSDSDDEARDLIEAQHVS